MECLYCRRKFQLNLSVMELLMFQSYKDQRLCPTCMSLFVSLLEEKRCRGCGRAYGGEYCADCQRWQRIYPNYDFQHVALYEYSEAMHEWFLQYKFRGDYRLRQCFSAELARFIRRSWPGWLLVPIPLSPNRLEQRGFNQVTAILDAAKLPYEEVLQKTTDSVPQSSKTRVERLHSAQPFCLTDRGKKVLESKRSILLIDDIYTTGSTLFHAYDCLAPHLKGKINSVSLAR